MSVANNTNSEHLKRAIKFQFENSRVQKLREHAVRRCTDRDILLCKSPDGCDTHSANIKHATMTVVFTRRGQGSQTQRDREIEREGERDTKHILILSGKVRATSWRTSHIEEKKQTTKLKKKTLKCKC